MTVANQILVCRVAKLEDIGLLKEGLRADLLLFDENLELVQTIIGGQTAWQAITT